MAVTGTDTTEVISSWIPRAPFDSVFGLVRHVAVAAFAGLITGVLVAGVGGRIFMRIAGAAAGAEAQGARTEAGFTVGEITFGGSLALVIFVGIFTGVAATLFYLILQPWLGWAGRWRGVAYGVVLFGIGSAMSDIMNPDNIDFAILGNGWLLVALIAVWFLIFGVIQDALFRLADRHAPGEELGWRQIGIPYVAITVLGVVASLAVVVGILQPEATCDCERPTIAYLGMLAAWIGTAMLWAAAFVRTNGTTLRRTAAILGYTGTLTAATFGLARAISDARDIIV